MVLRRNSSLVETFSILPTVDFFHHRLRPTTTSAEHAVSSAKDTAYASTWDRRYYSTNTGDRSHFTTAIPVLLRAYSLATLVDRLSLATGGYPVAEER